MACGSKWKDKTVSSTMNPMIEPSNQHCQTLFCPVFLNHKLPFCIGQLMLFLSAAMWWQKISAAGAIPFLEVFMHYRGAAERCSERLSRNRLNVTSTFSSLHTVNALFIMQLTIFPELWGKSVVVRLFSFILSMLPCTFFTPSRRLPLVP